MEAYLKPMLCGKADVVPEGDDWIAEPKMDGWRAIAHTTGRGVLLYCGRNGSDYSRKLPYIEELLDAHLPPDSVVDGELLGGEWGDVQGVMTRGDGPHVPSAHVPALTYVVFDATRIAGTDIRHMSWVERRTLLEQALLDAGDYVKVAPAGESTPATLQAMLDIGMEGIVCKRKDGRYENKRSNLWIKIKPNDTEDGEIIGFYDATAGSKYEGNSVGGLCFKLANGYEGRAAGMDDKLRAEMYEHPERFIGRTVELTHHGVQEKTGALRHPNFLRFRDDKDAPAPKPKAAPRVSAKPTKRNYGAMKDAKLAKVLDQLRAGDAEAVAKAGGPEFVERDIAAVEALIAERG